MKNHTEGWRILPPRGQDTYWKADIREKAPVDAGALVGVGYGTGQIRIEIQLFVGKADAELLLVSRFVIPSQKIHGGLEGKEDE